MKRSVALPQHLGPALAGTAARAEAIGFDGVYVFDHLTRASDPSAPSDEAVVALGAVAAATSRVTIGPMVLRVTLRPPDMVAALARTLWAIAPDRVLMGLGIGDRSTADEMARFGWEYAPVAERVTRLAATIDAVGAAGVPMCIGGTHPALDPLVAAVGARNLWETPIAEVPDHAVPGVTVSWAGRVAPGGGRPDVELSGSASITNGLDALVAAGCHELIATPVPWHSTALDDLAATILA